MYSATEIFTIKIYLVWHTTELGGNQATHLINQINDFHCLYDAKCFILPMLWRHTIVKSGIIMLFNIWFTPTDRSQCKINWLLWFYFCSWIHLTCLPMWILVYQIDIFRWAKVTFECHRRSASLTSLFVECKKVRYECASVLLVSLMTPMLRNDHNQ